MNTIIWKQLALAVVAVCVSLTAMAQGMELAADRGSAKSRDAAIAAMIACVNAEDSLSEGKKAALVEAINNVLGAAPALAKDKAIHAGEHLAFYFKELLDGKSAYTDEQFGVIVDTLRWSLGNYVRLPAMTEAQRDDAVAVFDLHLSAIGAVVEKTYLDTPADVRNDISKEARELFAETKAKLGNYFYPYFLYPDVRLPNGELPTAMDIVQRMSDARAFRRAPTRFARTAVVLGDADASQYIKDLRIEAYVRGEKLRVNTAAASGLMRLFNLMKERESGAYRPMPDSLRAARKSVFEERAAARKQRRAAKVPHEAMLKDILEGTDIKVVNGAVSLPPDLTPLPRRLAPIRPTVTREP